MILVPVRVAPSGIHGNGLFAAAFLARGTPIWRFERGFDRTLSQEVYGALPESARKFVRYYGYLRSDDQSYILSGDHSHFMNHSSSPNTGMPSDQADQTTTVALRDISEGEEITCDYFAFDAEAARKLGAE